MLRRIFAFVVSVIFFMETTPDDFWHLFAHHHDTVHAHASATSVSPLHTHCEALNSSLPVFTGKATLSISQFLIEVISFDIRVLHSLNRPKIVDHSGLAPPLV